ncbi:MAG: TetR/AcrR family transcriptional regulator [Pseudomonadota bacterium]
MVEREKAKDLNRAKIRAAAESIIRNEGIDKLTMRRLATEAGVSSRTPYNLFGSKTEVLIALMDGAQFDPFQNAPSVADRTVLQALLGALDQFETFIRADEEFFRVVFKEIVASDETDLRFDAVERVIAVGEMFIGQAKINDEIEGGTNVKLLAADLAYQVLTMMGMWSDNIYPIAQGTDQVRRGWCTMLMAHCSEGARPILHETYQTLLSPRK